MEKKRGKSNSDEKEFFTSDWFVGFFFFLLLPSCERALSLSCPLQQPGLVDNSYGEDKYLNKNDGHLHIKGYTVTI